ncbi:MAG TPA: hypothetical protein VM532_10735 [Burkholderiales bacterium]|nr:hypothetical protein [Burkholderiales bacterium]
MNQVQEEAKLAANKMMSWGDWWEQHGDETFDEPTELVDIEPLYK